MGNIISQIIQELQDMKLSATEIESVLMKCERNLDYAIKLGRDMKSKKRQGIVATQQTRIE